MIAWDWAAIFLWACLVLALVIVVLLPLLTWVEERRAWRRRLRNIGPAATAEEVETERLMTQKIRAALKAGELVKK